MGADPFENLAPWNDDPNEALAQLQATYMARHYDVEQSLKENLKGSREAVESCEKEGDEYGLLDHYKTEVRNLEEISSKPFPSDPGEQLEILRTIWESSGQGIGNILDVEGVSDEGGLFVARRLSEDELTQHFGTLRPTKAQAQGLLYKISGQIDRGESLCFPVYDGENPVGWYFLGYTVD